MTDDRSLERAARSWMEIGPTNAPEAAIDAALARIQTTSQERDLHVPWRTTSVNTLSRATVAIATAAVALIGVLLLQQQAFTGPGASPSSTSRPASPSPTSRTATPSPSPSAARSASAPPPASKTFVSPRYGYTVTYPASWRATPASASWSAGLTTNWGSQVVDDLRGTDIRLSAASQPLRTGETPTQRLQAMMDAFGTCDQRLPAPATVRVGGRSGTVAMNGCPTSAFDGGIAPGGHFYVVALVVEDRAYIFILDGNVDPDYLQTMLATVTFNPGSAVDPSPTP